MGPTFKTKLSKEKSIGCRATAMSNSDSEGEIIPGCHHQVSDVTAKLVAALTPILLILTRDKQPEVDYFFVVCGTILSPIRRDKFTALSACACALGLKDTD